VSNLYWPIYKNLEREVIELSNLVHFDDNQMSVYSVKITELLIRSSVEIESISKDLFLANGGEPPEERDLYFDTDCLKFLDEKWQLSKKVLILSSINFHFENDINKVITPLHKSFKRGTSGSDWKKAYQAVKHERVKSLDKGNIGHMIRALGALFILNLYYKNESFDLGKDSAGNSFPVNCGSELFSINVHVGSHDGVGMHLKKEDFSEAIYYVNWTQETGDVFQNSMNEFNQAVSQSIMKHPKVQEYISKNDMSNYKGNIGWDALGQEEYIRTIQLAQRATPIKGEQLQYEANLNTHTI
jgi:hypothetical protein